MSIASLLAGCSGPAKPVPKPLEQAVGLLGVKSAWAVTVGALNLSAEPRAIGPQIVVATADGEVRAIDATSGTVAWSLNVGAPLVSGVGGDGTTFAVVTDTGELVVLSPSKVLWRQRLGAASLTVPLVAGARVFTLSTDRTVTAFDAASGLRLWQQQRPSDALVLAQPGLLMAVGDNLVAGVGGRLIGFNSLTGQSRWEASIAVSRGTNEVERLVDVVAGATRVDGSVCVRSFQAAVACVDAGNGRLSWTRAAAGATGLGGNDSWVVGTEKDSRLTVWNRRNGDVAWSSDLLLWRGLGTPLVLGQSLVVGDGAGQMHFLAIADGATLNRVATDGSPIVGAPVLIGKTLVVATQKGGVFAFRPE
ncbi:MAG: PQQ-binding-like beta-propeller repeat protein [Rhodoferax sp.]|nr:PQQ-binding-like beta-propeller repeat protein [Rhodoferax sp.]